MEALKNFQLLQNKPLKYTFAAIGFYHLFSHLTCGIRGIYKYILRPHKNFHDRYFEKDSWVVITGGSDGIGYGFAEYFASKKFNIVLIAKTYEKLLIKTRELQQKYNVKVKPIQADFRNCDRSFYENIFVELQNLDIAVLINNVGAIQKFDYFPNWTLHEIYDDIALHTQSTVNMTHLLLPRMMKRTKKSAIINVTAGCANMNVIGVTMYAANKAFIDQFTKILALEQTFQGNKVDFLAYSPNGVKTNMVKVPLYVQVPMTVNGALKSLGREDYTKGHWTHAFQDYFKDRFPFYSNKIVFKLFKMMTDDNQKPKE